MNTLQYCSCGDVADGEGTRCARCCALQALGLESAATESEIKEAYRVLVKVWHPDRFPSDQKLRAAAEEKLKALNAAYVSLSSKTGKSDRRPKAGQTYSSQAPRARNKSQSVPRVKMRRRRFMPAPAVLMGLGALACGLLMIALVLRSMDSTLASDPSVGRVYLELRDGVMGRFRQAAGTIWGGTGERLHDLVSRPSAPIAAASPEPVDAAQQGGPAGIQPDSLTGAPAQSAHRRELGAAQAAPAKLMPYLTVGLTKDEVIAIEGAPTQTAENKLVYGGSEIDFTAGKVSGWKIDMASAPIRVKLWPDAPVDPDLDSFGVGSSKNVVLVVQGTPTYFSENEFGYGGAAVYFRNGRVVGWKDGPAGAALRTAPRN